MAPLAPLARAVCVISAALGIGNLCAKDNQKGGHDQQDVSSKSPYPVPAGGVDVGNGECKLQQVHMLARHGTRNPSEGSIEDLNALSVMIAAAKSGIPDSLKDYKNAIPAKAASQLVPQGVQDHAALAQRDMKRYASLVKSKNDVAARADDSARVIDSGHAYLTSMFGSGDLLKTLARGEPLLTPFEGCKKTDEANAAAKAFNKKNFPDEIGKSTAGREFSKANLGKVVEILQKNVPGIKWNTTLVSSAYDACQTEYSVDGNFRWCEVFEKKGLAIMSLHDDIDFNFKNGISAPVPKLGCALLTDMVSDMEKTNGPVKMSLNFAHAETVGPFATTLGLFLDKKPIDGSSNPDDDREFRSNVVAPLAANVHIELWTCGSEPTVRVLHNEVPVKIPACDDKINCPLAAFKTAFKDQIGCNVETRCGGKSAPDPSSAD